MRPEEHSPVADEAAEGSAVTFCTNCGQCLPSRGEPCGRCGTWCCGSTEGEDEDDAANAATASTTSPTMPPSPVTEEEEKEKKAEGDSSAAAVSDSTDGLGVTSVGEGRRPGLRRRGSA